MARRLNTSDPYGAEAPSRAAFDVAGDAAASRPAGPAAGMSLEHLTLDAMPAPVALLDPSGTILCVNEAWRRFGRTTGGREPSCGVGSSYLAMCDAAAAEDANGAAAIAAKLRRVLSGTIDQIAVRYPHHGGDGERWYRCVIRAIHLSDGPLGGTHRGAVVIHVDATEQVRLEATIRRARDRAVAACAAKSRFIAELAHELRTALNAIIGFSDIQRAECLGPLGDPRYREYAEDIHSEGRRLLAIIDRILNLAKVESGRIELDERVVDVADVFAPLFKRFDAELRRKDLVMTIAAARPLPPLAADEGMLLQMLSNLIGNAVKFTQAGGRIDLSAELESFGWMRIAVRDTGVGMSQDEIARVLEPYAQVRSSLGGGGQSGIGLGLAIVRGMMALHDGKLDIESAPGAGTRVSLLFPPKRVVAAA